MKPTCDMGKHARLGKGAIALAALVLIWNEAPIADSPHRIASSDTVEQPMPDSNAGHTVRQPSEAVVKGDRTGVGPAAEPARPGAPADAAERSDGERTGVGPEAAPGVPSRAKNVGH